MLRLSRCVMPLHGAPGLIDTAMQDYLTNLP